MTREGAIEAINLLVPEEERRKRIIENLVIIPQRIWYKVQLGDAEVQIHCSKASNGSSVSFFALFWEDAVEKITIL